MNNSKNPFTYCTIKLFSMLKFILGGLLLTSQLYAMNESNNSSSDLTLIPQTMTNHEIIYHEGTLTMDSKRILLSVLLPLLQEKTGISIYQRGDFDPFITVSLTNEPLDSALIKIAPNGIAVTLQHKGESNQVIAASFYGEIDSGVERTKLKLKSEPEIKESSALEEMDTEGSDVPVFDVKKMDSDIIGVTL